MFGPTQESVGQNSYGGIWRKIELLMGMFAYLIPPYSWTLDRFLTIVLPLAVLLLIIVRRVEFARLMIWPLLAMLLLFLVMPMELFSGYGTDHRLLVPIGLILAGSLRLVTRKRSGWVIAGGLIATLIMVRVTAITIEWRRAD